MKINFFTGDEYHTWNSQHETFIVREDQEIYFELTELEDAAAMPLLLIEEYELPLTSHDSSSGKVLRSHTACVFKEFFGLAVVSIYVGELRFELRFEVIIKKSNAQQVEEMIGYLTHKQDDIIRICLSQTSDPTQKQATTAPETLLNTVEMFLNTLSNCRLELQHHLRKRLIPIKQPAWKSSQVNNIDPFDIIFNLDTLEPVLGEGDVVVNGRSFSISEIEVTTLEATANVEENAILLGGLYSMRRALTALLHTIEVGFPKSKQTLHNSDYESLSDVLLRLTSASMRHRCEIQLPELEEFIRYFEKKIGVVYRGESHPVMTPFVRSSRVYRRLFEQLHEWYTLDELSLDSRNCLVKLRSVSKIYEFVALFKIIDYLYARNWEVVDTHWAAHLEFVPSKVLFKRGELMITLDYETKVYPFNPQTQHFDLVDMGHSSAEGLYHYRCPDFVLRLDGNHKSVYIILDAKYSSAGTVKNYSLPDLFNKYFVNMAVYDSFNEYLKQEMILGVIALFPDKYALAVYMNNWNKYGLHKKPLRLPIVTGLPLLPQTDAVAYQAFSQLLEIAQRQLKE